MTTTSGVPANVSKLLEAAQAKQQSDSKIAFAVAAKQVKASEQMGDAMVQLVAQAATVQQQLASGRLDVRA
jgi:hypothetical protein